MGDKGTDRRSSGKVKIGGVKGIGAGIGASGPQNGWAGPECEWSVLGNAKGS